jgi:ribosome-associated protein
MPAKKTSAKTSSEQPAAPIKKVAAKKTMAVKKPAAKKPAAKKAAAVKKPAAKKPAAKKAAAKKTPVKKAAAKKVVAKKAVAKKAPVAPPAPPKPVLPPLVQRILDLLADKKAESVVVLDMRKLSSVTDFYVIASGSSGPQLRAMSEDLAFRLKKEGQPVHRRAGSPESQWMVLDYLDVIVHVMSPESRAYYAIEDLWNDAPRILPG